MTKEETPQEFADRQYTTGYRDGLCDAITQFIGFVSDEHQEYIFKEIELELNRQRRNKFNREQKRKWGP
jgi:hypothetical protein